MATRIIKPPPEGVLIKSARLRKGWSAEVCAAEAGIGKTYWLDIERGWRPRPQGHNPRVRGTTEMLAKIAQVVGLGPEDFASCRPDVAAELLGVDLGIRPVYEVLQDVRRVYGAEMFDVALALLRESTGKITRRQRVPIKR